MMMRSVRVAAIAFGVLATLVPAAVRADNIWDVENARANARAGGPVSAYDAELLDRWGCLSGTQSAFCQSIKHGATSGWYRRHQRRARR
jgi:hypothetical protein